MFLDSILNVFACLKYAYLTYPCKSADASLGGNVGCGSGLADVANQAGDVDDVALHLAQVGQSVLAGGEVAEQFQSLLS